MAKQCKNCGKKLPFLTIFTSESICEDCKKKIASEITTVEEGIIATKSITEEQKEFLKKQDNPTALKIYSDIYTQFEADKELEETELDALEAIQNACRLTNEDIKFDERIKPYLYVQTIRKEGKLPSVKLHVGGTGEPILKKGEIVHFASEANLKEIRTVGLGYTGGSHGVSIRIAKGVSYRVGAHRGHIEKEDRLVDTSYGVLIITNKRIFLQPAPGNKPLNIPLTKILSYNCYNNGLDVYKEGREKGYFFSINNSGSVEICGICLGHLLLQNED